jgi:hypothetical protein
MEIHYLLYASKLVAPLGHKAVAELLHTSQRNNALSGLTGFLQIENGIVLQYLEGPEEGLLVTIQKIRKDPRHRNFEILAQDVTDRRFFDSWNMAYVDAGTLSLFDLIGASTGEVPVASDVDPLDLIKLLAANASYLSERPREA